MRSSFKAQDPKSHKSVTEVLIIRARVDGWIDGLIKAGCPPWDKDEKNREEIKVGWFPEVEEMPWDGLVDGEELVDCLWQNSR